MPPSPLAELLAGPQTIPVAPAKAVVGLPADLLRRRPDVRRAELLAAAESAKIGFEKAELYPAVSITGNFGYLASDWGQFDLSDMFSGHARTFAIGPAVQWNILNYGQITNRVRAQDASYQAAIFNFQTVVLTAQREVEDGLAQFLQSRVRAEALARSASAAKRSFELSLLQYREGIVDFTTVLTAQQDLLQAQDNLVNAMGDIPQGLILTYRAIGGGWQLREGGDFVPPAVQSVMAERTDWGNLLTPVNSAAAVRPWLAGPREHRSHRAATGMVGGRTPIQSPRKRIVLGFLALALVVGCKEKNTFVPPPPPKVTVAEPVQKPVTDSLDFTGNTQAIYTVQLPARVEGYLEVLHFQDGADVKKGDLLFTIQPEQYQAQLQQVEAEVLNQKAALFHAEDRIPTVFAPLPTKGGCANRRRQLAGTSGIRPAPNS